MFLFYRLGQRSAGVAYRDAKVSESRVQSQTQKLLSDSPSVEAHTQSMQLAFEHRCSLITRVNGCGFTRRSHSITPGHGSSCTRLQRAQRHVMRASDNDSKSHKQTDTSPEGKGEQREQPANRTDGRMTWTKLRVERQTHLPASREEAWQALQSLLPKKEWKETSAVFASLEAIYR